MPWIDLVQVSRRHKLDQKKRNKQLNFLLFWHTSVAAAAICRHYRARSSSTAAVFSTLRRKTVMVLEAT